MQVFHTTRPIIRERIPSVKSPLLHYARDIDVLLPPAYYHDKHQHYPVLYLNDGQDLDALHLPTTLAHMYSHGHLKPMILVAIHATRDRVHEYGIEGLTNALGYGLRTSEYSAFLRYELMHEIERRYRVKHGPKHTAIAGFSLGGLSAFDTAWAHPDLFGAVGVFSGSFWWRSDDSSTRAKVVSRIMHRRVRTSHFLPHIRMWFQAGTLDELADRDNDGIIDAIQDTTELIDTLAARGYQRGIDMTYVEVVGGKHDQVTWGKVMPEFLVWWQHPPAW